MKTIDEFIAMVNEEIGLDVSRNDAGRHLDELAGWDSVHLLTLVTVVERRTGRQLPFVEVLEATSLRDIYALAVA